MSDLCNTGWLVLFSPCLADLKIKYFINLSILRSPLRPSVSNSVFTSALSSFLSLSPCFCTCTAESVLSSFGNYVCCLIETSCYGLLAVSLCDLLCAECTCSCVCVCVCVCVWESVRWDPGRGSGLFVSQWGLWTVSVCALNRNLYLMGAAVSSLLPKLIQHTHTHACMHKHTVGLYLCIWTMHDI